MPDQMTPVRQDSDLDPLTLLALTEKVAVKKHDGHVTILRFTTGWKSTFCTPDLDSHHGREQVKSIPAHSSLRDSLIDLLLEHHRVP